MLDVFEDDSIFLIVFKVGFIVLYDCNFGVCMICFVKFVNGIVD